MLDRLLFQQLCYDGCILIYDFFIDGCVGLCRGRNRYRLAQYAEESWRSYQSKAAATPFVYRFCNTLSNLFCKSCCSCLLRVRLIAAHGVPALATTIEAATAAVADELVHFFSSNVVVE